MRTVFADTFYYFALLNRSDDAHARAARLTAQFDGRMMTTAWVLTEVADAVITPKDRTAFHAFYETLIADPGVCIIEPSESLFERGMALHADRNDKAWSLTDCISFVVMQEHAILEALTGDHHFEQAGFIALLK